jgi:hypothetical protein
MSGDHELHELDVKKPLFFSRCLRRLFVLPHLRAVTEPGSKGGKKASH